MPDARRDRILMRALLRTLLLVVLAGAALSACTLNLPSTTAEATDGEAG
jgi:hypothetical protein